MPLTLTVQPWARLYELPDGRRLWTLRIWVGDRAVTRVVSTSVLVHYAVASGLVHLCAEVERLARRHQP